MKIIKNGNSIVVITSEHGVLHKNNCTKEFYEAIKQVTDSNKLLAMMVDGYDEVVKKKEAAEELISKLNNSQFLRKRGDSVYWEGISELSMPQSLVEAVIKAEEENNVDALTAYKNFWILLSLNPDSRCRENLYWFLEKWGMKISKTGLIIGYRNVDVYQKGTKSIYTQEFCDYVTVEYARIREMKKATGNYYVFQAGGYYHTTQLNSLMYKDMMQQDEPMFNLKSTYEELKAVDFKVNNIGDDTIYTDHHSHTFRIKIGEIVTMPREDTDTDSNVSCSRGLHIGGLGWLKKCYFGTQGLVCLINPAKVVAVPHIDDYGKLRTCEYLPIALVDYDENGDVIPYNVEDGFDSKWAKEILYDGELSTEEHPTYRLDIPQIPELNKTIVDNNLLELARTYIKE